MQCLFFFFKFAFLSRLHRTPGKPFLSVLCRGKLSFSIQEKLPPLIGVQVKDTFTAAGSESLHEWAGIDFSSASLIRVCSQAGVPLQTRHSLRKSIFFS